MEKQSILPCERRDETNYCNIRNMPCSYSDELKARCEQRSYWLAKEQKGRESVSSKDVSSKSS